MKKLISCLVLLFLATISLAQWEPDLRLTNNGASSRAAISNTWGIAGNGNLLYVVWFDDRDGNNEIYYKCSANGGNTWDADTRITGDPYESVFPGLVVSGQIIHVSWEDTRNGEPEIYYKRSVDGGQIWSSDVRISYGNSNASMASMTTSDPYVHIVWQDTRNNNDEIYYKRSANAGETWGQDMRLSDNAGYSGCPTVAVSETVVHIVWEDDRDENKEIYYRRSPDNGFTWGPELRLTNTLSESGAPSIWASGTTVHVAFQEDNGGAEGEIFYMRSIDSGLTWEASVQLSGNTSSSRCPNICASGQDVHVVWSDLRDGQQEIYYRESLDGGISWPDSEDRLTNNVGASANPTLFACPASVNIVWNDDRDANNEIYYKRYRKTAPDTTYYKRLFYLCKAWGHAKYLHSGIAAGNINWDDELFRAIIGAKYSLPDEGFNDSLQMILENAGPMGISADPLPAVPDSMNNNTDFSWIQSEIFSDTVRALLDTIRVRFRPQSNIYVSCSGWSPNFQTDDQYYQESYFPPEEKRLLALFRYWNIIHYFFPYENLMDQDWDTTLVEFIPAFVQATDALSYMLALKEFTTRINDTHGYLYGTTFSNWRGVCFPPFQVVYVENEMVVKKVLEGNPDISTGDVVKAIDGIDIYQLRDSLRRYAHGSNGPAIERELNDLIMYGPEGSTNVVLDDGIKMYTASFIRDSYNYFNLMQVQNTSMWYDTVINGTCHFGYVNMPLLDPDSVDLMFTELWETDAIIFDIRNRPNYTIDDIVPYLYSNQLEFAKHKWIDCTYPGTMIWISKFWAGGLSEPYTGQIIILFNEMTQSHAEWTCMHFEPFPGLIKIGSQTAGADGDVSEVRLPGGFVTKFSGLGVCYPDYTPTQRIGIVPDYEVLPTIAGLREGIDEVLAFAMDCTLLGKIESHDNEKWLLYPNPCQDQLHLKIPFSDNYKRAQVEVYDIYGKVVFKLDKSLMDGQIDLTGRSRGAYIVRIITEDGNYIRKVLKQ